MGKSSRNHRSFLAMTNAFPNQTAMCPWNMGGFSELSSSLRSVSEGRQGAVQRVPAGPEAQRGCGAAAERVGDSGELVLKTLGY